VNISPSPLVWAHRGARSVAPENTLSAAGAAQAQGARGWELDVRLTLDGAVVVAHDLGLRRVTDIAFRPDMPVRADHRADRLTLAQIRSLDAGSWFARRDPFGTVARGDVRPEDLESFAGERIPTLDEALEWTRQAGMDVNIEIKDMQGGDDARLVRETARLVRASGLEGRALVSSFRPASLALFRDICPEVPTGLLLDHKAGGASRDAILEQLRSLGASALHPPLKGLNSGVVGFFRDAGFGVNVYTVNYEEDMFRMAREGVTGIFTDFPARARAVYERMTTGGTYE
jgi:glycerophosphoryl diester phosphodiesterase